MKKSIKSIAATLVVAIAAAAPMQSHAIDFGVRAGFDVTTPGNVTSDGPSLDWYNPGCGFHVGVVADINLPYNLFFEPGLNLVYHTTTSDINERKGLTLRQFGMAIPLRLGYNFDLKVCDLRIFTGPSFGIGFTGKWHDDRGSYDAYVDEGLSRFNMGWNLGAGVKIDHFYVGLDYTFGLNDRFLNDETSWRQGALAVSLGYYF